MKALKRIVSSASRTQYRTHGSAPATFPNLIVYLRGPRRGAGRERHRQVQQQGSQRAEALAERSVEIAQAMVPLAGALARGGG